MNKYKLINWVARLNWEGAIIEQIATGKRYITNGVYFWEARKERIKKCNIVDSIDRDKFYKYFKDHFQYLTIEEQ